MNEAAARCLDCGGLLTGRYCAACGQPANTRVLSMHDVAHDLVHSVLHLDSRVWKTLRSLLLRPGELTNAFIEGKRQRYLPPFRLYLVLSVLFFALSALLPDAELVHTNVDGDTVIGYAEPGIDATDFDVPAGTHLNLDLPGLDGKLDGALEKLKADGGAALSRAFLANAPKLMFVFLPLMAAVSLLFYWKPRRLYAEHLVLFLHTHAFLFLVLSVMTVLDALTRLGTPLLFLAGLARLLAMLYAPAYVYRAMRRVYREGRLVTGIKFVAIAVIYFVLLGITLLGGLLYSALSL